MELAHSVLYRYRVRMNAYILHDTNTTVKLGAIEANSLIVHGMSQAHLDFDTQKRLARSDMELNTR
jgi:hypothetical protein